MQDTNTNGGKKMKHLFKALFKKLNDNLGLAGFLFTIVIACFPTFFVEHRLLVITLVLGVLVGMTITVASLQDTNNNNNSNQNGPNNTP